MIPGLRYVPGYLDCAAHDALRAAVDAVPWRAFGERRAQIYGYSFHYTKGGIYRVEDLPAAGVGAVVVDEREKSLARPRIERLESDHATESIAFNTLVNN